MSIVPVKGQDVQGAEVAWFAPLCSDDFRHLGVPDGDLRSNWANTSRIVERADELGYRIKLLGISKRTAAGIELRVHPCLVPAKRLIANVEGAMNAVMVQADAVGTTLYYGKGAGSEPTASAVIADLVDITRLHTADPLNRVPHLAFQPDAMSDLPVLPMAQVVTSYYLRLRVADQAGVLAKVTGILANADNFGTLQEFQQVEILNSDGMRSFDTFLQPMNSINLTFGLAVKI